VLGRYVRELGVLDLPTAVQKMTSLPAAVFGIEDRGAIRLQAWADLCVFDPATVADQATFTAPLRPPVGIRWVIVNGTVAVDGGEVQKERAGAVLRRRGPAPARR
jgi:N-acyl-D-aspartate/D-glutamate deacylase